MKSTNQSPGHKWRCRSCGLLLGIAQGQRVEIRYKDARYLAYGGVCAVCRRCGETNAHGCSPVAVPTL